MKKILYLLLLAPFLLNGQSKKEPLFPIKAISSANAVVGCSVFNNSQNYTCNPAFVVAAPVDNSSGYEAPAGTNFGCYGTRPNQLWFLVTVTSGSNLSFRIDGVNNGIYYDIDALIWGPIPNGNYSNACSVTSSTPLSCDWDSGSADLSLSNVQVGQVYLMMVTNYSNAPNTIIVTQPSGGTVNYCMANLQPTCQTASATISGTQTIAPGQNANLTLSFSGTSPWNYSLTDGTNGVATSSPFTVSVSPAQTTTYSLSSVSNSCGPGSVSGSATVSVQTQKISCYSFSSNPVDGYGNNNGENYGAILTNDRFGKPAKAYNFDGNDYIQLPLTNLTNSNYSYSFWVRPTFVPNYGNATTMLSIGGQSVLLSNSSFYNRLVWNFVSYNTSGANTSLITSESFPVQMNQWTHIVAVRTNSDARLYINGQLVSVGSVAGTPDYSNAAYIGRRGGSASQFMIGDIDDIQIYNGALLNEEITALYNLGMNDNCDAYLHTEQGLVSCYSMSGNTNDDYKNNHGVGSLISSTSDRFDNLNSAYSFGGGNSFAISNVNQFLTNTYTYSAWVKATSLPSSGGTSWILGIGQTGVGDQSIYIYNNGTVNTFAAHSYASPSNCLSNGLLSIHGGVSVNANQWYHIVVTMNNNAYRMYVDGKLVSSAASSCTNMTYGSSPVAHIGSRFGYLSTFNGIIDDVRIYNRVLNEDEVINLQYTKGCRTKCPESITFSTQYSSGFPKREEASQITANNTITNNTKVRFDGANYVLLQPGFKVESGVVFEATNNGCGGSK